MWCRDCFFFFFQDYLRRRYSVSGLHVCDPEQVPNVVWFNITKPKCFEHRVRTERVSMSSTGRGLYRTSFGKNRNLQTPVPLLGVWGCEGRSLWSRPSGKYLFVCVFNPTPSDVCYTDQHNTYFGSDYWSLEVVRHVSFLVHKIHSPSSFPRSHDEKTRDK